VLAKPGQQLYDAGYAPFQTGLLLPSRHFPIEERHIDCAN
jgi:hypothetical protein